MPETTSPRELAVHIVSTLHAAGYVAYLAGGCVRDRLLGLQPKDYDVATDARPEQVLRLFRRARYVGEAFGVVRVTGRGCAVEVATFRAEWGYADGRRPTHVQFTDARTDAQRRDFTINGLFESPLVDDEAQRVIDFVGGVGDLRAGVVRAIGEPDHRFSEDYLRMLRAVRFAARFGFTIEQRTASAIRVHARYLSQISRERIGMEVGAMLGPGVAAPGPRDESLRLAAARLIQQLTLDGPTLNEDHRDAPLPTVARLGGDAAYPVALAAWIIDRHAEGCAGPDAAAFFTRDAGRVVGRWRRALCLSNELRDALAGTLALLPRSWEWGRLRVAHRKRLLAQQRWPDALTLLRAAAHDAGVAQVLERLDADAPALRQQGVAPRPMVTGDDLVAMGMAPGPRVGRLLDEVYDEQLEGAFADEEAARAWVRERL